jgi:hypothetical protein
MDVDDTVDARVTNQFLSSSGIELVGGNVVKQAR